MQTCPTKIYFYIFALFRFLLYLDFNQRKKYKNRKNCKSLNVNAVIYDEII